MDEDYAERAGVGLVPLGLAGSGVQVLMVDEDGRWHGGFDDLFGPLGDNTMGGLNLLVSGPPGFILEL